MTIKILAEKVEQMRRAQKKYFTQASKVSHSQKQIMLEYSKKVEKEVDEIVDKILNPVSTAQTSMFIDRNTLETSHC